MKIRITLSTIIVIISISFGCSEKESEKEIVAPNMSAIKYLSVTNQGCQSSMKILKSNEIEWSYSKDTLKIETIFMANCSAKYRDSVKTNENTIEIYSTDISETTARCSCVFIETFKFYAKSPKKIEVIIYYKSKSSTEFSFFESKSIEI